MNVQLLIYLKFVFNVYSNGDYLLCLFFFLNQYDNTLLNFNIISIFVMGWVGKRTQGIIHFRKYEVTNVGLMVLRKTFFRDLGQRILCQCYARR